LREMTELIKEREALKLTDATMLRDLVDAIYFPIPPMLAPILNKALQYVDSEEPSLMISANMCI
jgi:NuA3 HAT complex component NTO1